MPNLTGSADKEKNTMKDFECNKCGACCWIIGCDKLGPDNLCTIYENRPQECIGDSTTNTLNACKQCRDIRRLYRRKNYKPQKRSILEIIALSNVLIKN